MAIRGQCDISAVFLFATFSYAGCGSKRKSSRPAGGRIGYF